LVFSSVPALSWPVSRSTGEPIHPDRLDYRIERQRHEGFVGRTALLAERNTRRREG